MTNDKKTFVTQPFLPPLDEFNEYLKDIWETKSLTNNGKYHQLLEEKLTKYLKINYISLFSNGTTALISALQSLRITGEVITTPFSFVATAHSLLWNGIKPVFCDIEEETMNIDANKIEALITPQTTAIMPVHVYGNPCNMKKIKEIADIYGLKVIYDSAHAFGVEVNNNSILNYGDLSILSFHATKTFTTMEGGAIVSNNKEEKKRIDYLKNFGFVEEEVIIGHGINGKLNELQASFGLLYLKYIDELIEKRKKIAGIYLENLKNKEGVILPIYKDNVKYNYSYFPIRINKLKFGKSRDDVYKIFRKHNIWVRKYFYPLISDFNVYKGLPSSSHKNLPNAVKISNEILCLPIYPDLEIENVYKICEILNTMK